MTPDPRPLDQMLKADPPPRINLGVVADTLPEGVLTTYGLRAWTEELDRVRDAPEGTRNDTFNRAAFSLLQLVASGDLADAPTQDALWDAAMDAGLEHDETRATLRSAAGAAHLKPRPEREQAPLRIDSDGVINDADVLPAERVRSSWWPQDIAAHIDGAAEPPAMPSFLQRNDGRFLFYAGKVNGLIGTSESGKSWLALTAVQQAMEAGYRVTYVDFEDSAADVVGRLRLMGSAPATLHRLFCYVGPEAALDAVARGDFVDHLTDHVPELVVMDGVNAAMTLMAMDPLDNADATKFTQLLLRPVAKTGACVITVDHLPKSKDGRDNSFAIGAQAKKAMVDGCALTVEVAQAFGVGQHGRMKLTVAKDRAGQVRGFCDQAKHAGEFHLDSSDPAKTNAWIETAAAGTWRPTGLMARASALLATQTEPVSQSQLEVLMGGKATTARTALGYLAQDGYAAFEHGPRNALLFRHVQLFTESDTTTQEFT